MKEREAKLMQLKPIGRRELLTGMAGFGLATMLPSSLRAATPKAGGHFAIGTADYSTSDVLDPTVANTRMQLYLQWQIRNNLIEVGPNGVLIPELAETWEGLDGAKRWVFKLRKGVEFHNGKTFTARDAAYSIDLHRKPGTKSVVKPFAAPIESIKPTSDYELEIRLKDGNVSFPSIMALYAFNIVQDGDTKFDKGMGTGGYVLEAFEPGIRSLVRRNLNYWKLGRAHFDSVEIFAMKDVTARTSALLSGKIHAYNFVDLNTVKVLTEAPKVRVQKVAGKEHYVFPMLTDTPPFDNNNVRLAMKYAIDREDVLTRVLNGYGTIGNDQPLCPAYEFFASELEQRKYDPDKAKYYLKKAGAEGLAIQLHVSETPFAGATDAALLYREHAAKAGIKMEVIREPEDGYWDNVWSKKSLCASRWSGRINEDAMIGTAYSADALKTGWNETHWNNDQLNTLLIQARTEFDTAKRREMYAEMQKIIRDEGGATIPVFADFVDAVSTSVAHEGQLSAEWDLDGGRASERWWFV
jgi:peptide/nickel transport system substrate-binding protein